MSPLVQIEETAAPAVGDPISLDLSGIREKLASAKGPEYWKSLEQIAETPEFVDLLKHEFPAEVDVWEDPVGRRRFVQLMGASLALAGVTGCTVQPKEYIHPYARQPVESTPGKPRYFATALNFGAYAEPVLVESHEGRPTKIEGNPDHSASNGATSLFAQASILNMYDPDRLQEVISRGRVGSWETFESELIRQANLQRLKRGAGLRILSGPTSSPTFGGLIARIREVYPEAKWHQYEPVSRDSARAGAMAAFGEYVETRYDLSKAKVILALDSDFLANGPGVVDHIRAFARGRKVADGNADMNRLYAVEPTVTSTGSVADHRLRLKSAEIEGFALALAGELGVDTGVSSLELPAHAGAWLDPLTADLQAAGAAAVVIPGDQQPASVHALAHAMNLQLGSMAVVHTAPVEVEPVDQVASLKALAADMNGGAVETLLIIGGNPVYDSPADIDFAGALDHVGFRARLGLWDDETSEICHWRLPLTHELEAWGDTRTLDGQVTIQQPLIAPIYGSRSGVEVLSLLLLEDASHDGQSLVRAQWGELDDATWRKALHDGVVADSASPAMAVSLAENWNSGLSAPVALSGTELILRPDPAVWDGVFNNNGWMQELPKPQTKLTWDNVAMVSPATAETMNLSNGNVVNLSLGDATVQAPVWVTPGQADDCITAHLGFGRTRTGRVGTHVGFNAYALRTSTAMWGGGGAGVVKNGEDVELACTQDHYSMEGRNLVRRATVEEYEAHPNFAQAGEHGAPDEHDAADEHAAPGVGALNVGSAGRDREDLPPGFRDGRTQGVKYGDAEHPKSFYPEYNYDGRAWGMTIDLNACVGCNACMAACQSENNIPIVGKTEVLIGREMHWLRMDRYYSGSLDDPETHHQPVLCMQCEKAPCEPVCPVGATIHSDEGLNDMVYNRCVGTRYCSNNCPYKVRRFNFYRYTDLESPSLKLMNNPDVTVRHRGVMEKCTYCTQRINHARIDADKAGRPITDGEIKTACEQACPAEAITFGDINDPESKVTHLKHSERNYGLLTEINTQPRTTYLARVRNPNPAMPAPSINAGEA